MCNSPVQLSDQHDANVDNCTQLPYRAHFIDILTEYPSWSTDTNDIENTRSNQAQYRSDRQEILTAWQKDTPVKMPDNRQVLDNLEADVQDKLSITRPLYDRLSQTENSLPGAQTVTVVMVQSDQLTIRLPNNSPNNTEICQQDDNDYPDDRKNIYIRYMVQQMYIHLLIIPQMIKILIIHIKDRERYMCQLIQIEKS